MNLCRKSFLLLSICLVAFGIQDLQASTIQSSFEANNEGWTLSGGELIWSDSGGNPGGYIIAKDTINTTMELEAPAKFLGNWSAFENGIISFDAIEIENPYGPWSTFGTITITGDTGSVSKDLAPDPLPSSWTHYSAKLTAEEWGVSSSDWTAILNNVTTLEIDIESGSIVAAETVGVDNIAVNAVPIPGGIWLIGSGLAGIFSLRRMGRIDKD